MKKALAGLRAYQEAERRPAPPAMPIVARAGRAMLRDYGGSGPSVLFVPSLINPPSVLDLAEDNSLLRRLAAEGLRPLLVDWGDPDPAERGLSIAGHVETMLLPLIDAIGEPVSLAGYCLGGTMAMAAAALRPLRSLALIAAPWRFDGFPQTARDGLSDLWDQAHSSAETLGLLPMEVLQAAFWQLDPARTIGKYERFGTLDPGSEGARAFVTLEDWANAGPPLTFAAARELIDDCFVADLPGRGRWRVGGRAIDPAAIACPVLDIVSTTDRIVPAASAAGIGETVTLAQGHVGMMVGGRARATLWPKLSRWLSQPQ
ncbi:alpha/beta fold hydrolase [Flavisphingomonas formosensis]|uniref:alpha/beta fold hydrolase n=1 Tax=Flavisphingomonas formosensis TaxID=861534 RepID=UPI001E3D4977|nr:alpha/beta fold hydrolase [Sphingomonas formosensis]